MSCFRSPTGVHYWVCDAANGQTMSKARCKYCGKVEALRNYLCIQEISLMLRHKSMEIRRSN